MLCVKRQAQHSLSCLVLVHLEAGTSQSLRLAVSHLLTFGNVKWSDEAAKVGRVVHVHVDCHGIVHQLHQGVVNHANQRRDCK